MPQNEPVIKQFPKWMQAFALCVLLCSLPWLPVSAQEGTTILKGLIENDRGEKLMGVSVQLSRENTAFKKGIITDENGLFQFLELPAGGPYTITITYVGFETQIIRKESLQAGRSESMLIRMMPAVSAMEGIVVVGYGSQKKKDITGAVASVPQSRLQQVPNQNIAQVLQGSVAGFMVQQTNAGAASQESMMIRGRKSILASNTPLIVVDGIPYSGQLRDISVNDIASIDVLKDASAAAIYGSRGSNGVVLITTKSGAKGKPVLSYDGKYATQEAIRLPHYMNGEEFYAFKNTREPGKITASEQKAYDNGKAVNWEDYALRTGQSQTHNLSVSGGFQDTKYFFGGSYLNIKGVSVNDDYKRYTSRINLETRILNWLTIGTRTQLTFDNRNGVTVNWDDVYKANPLTTPYDSNGLLTIYPWPEFTDIGNPLEPIKYDNLDKSYQLLTNNYLIVDVPFVKGLSYRLNTGIRKSTADYSNYAGSNTKSGLELGGVASTSRTLEDNTVIENIVSYNKQIGKSSVFATGVYSYEENTRTQNTLNAQGFPNDFLTYYAMAQASLVTPSFGYNHTAMISQMLRVNYAYDSRYLLTLTGRRDGYSGFGANNKWGLFPSVAIGWNLRDEAFFPWKNTVDKLKIRASLGKNGNQAVGAYESISRLDEYNMVALNQSLPGYVPSKLGQDNLGWESTSTFNLGVDFGLFNGRISGDVNVYETRTNDLLLNRTISLVHGINTITQNIGATQNRGIELSLTTQNINSKGFTWTTTGNLTYVKNKIVSLYGNLDATGKETDDVANKWFIGQPILVNYDYVFNGVWQTSEAAAAAVWNSKPGSIKILDGDDDKRLTADDRRIIGQQDPKLLWGMSNAFSWKNFGLEVFFMGVHGVTKQNALLQDVSASSEVRRNVLLKNWWTPANPTNDFYANALDAEKMAGITTNIYEDASFIRLKDVSLSYDLSSRVQKTGISRLQLYVTGRNLMTITKWTASDPELNYGRGAVPLQREIVFGANVNF